jgi:hypothetical protein
VQHSPFKNYLQKSRPTQQVLTVSRACELNIPSISA